MTWREYHEATKHTPERLARSRHALDWATMPDPFRHYEGVPVIDLPADPPAPEIPALDVLAGRQGPMLATDGAQFLSQLFFYSASISATKVVPGAGYRYALRVNPSSGNLHPTEFHFATRGLAGWEDGLYHYRVSSHMAEQRALGDYTRELLPGTDAPLVILLTSIPWREAWKYQERAYRYCLLDIGHAAEAVALAARAIGAEARIHGGFDDEAIGRLCRLEDEWPMLLLEVRGAVLPLSGQGSPAGEWLGGAANALSPVVVSYPLIQQAHTATMGMAGAAFPQAAERLSVPVLPPSQSFSTVVRRRRSALDFRGGLEEISREQFGLLLSLATPSPRYVTLYAYVHRVRDLAPGVYRYDAGQLHLLREGDQQVMAAALSLSQALAGNSCVTFSMVADLERAAMEQGDRGYRHTHFEAGSTGQRLYLAAEAMGFQATGIGAFYDEEVHTYLGITPEQGQVVYHFACGFAAADPRLSPPSQG